MDTDDVSSVGEYIQKLDEFKEVLMAAEAREGQLPRDRKSAGEIIMRHEMGLLERNVQQLMPHRAQHMIHSSIVAAPYLPSIASLDILKPIYIKDLRIGIHHRGTYLIIRSLTEPKRITAVMAVVEDENRDAISLQLYHQLDENIRPDSSIIAKGDVLLIKEPFFKLMSDGEYGLRVDHVSDVMRIDARHKLWPKGWIPLHKFSPSKTANEWKEKGNADMGRKHHWAAVESYATALASNPSASEETIIRLNRALAYLQDENFEAALADTQCLGPNPSTSEKALYRAGRALYGLGRFSQCCNILQTLRERYPHNLEAEKDLARVRLRLSEQKSGRYDFKAINEEVSKARPPHLDHATFIGPIVVQDSPGRGRGLFTTKAVKAGDLPLCEKAFAYCFADDSKENSKGGSK